jgi:hypothetical protein
LAASQIATSVTILNSLSGYDGLSLTNMYTSSLSQIASGSVIEVAGAFFKFASDDTINASSWTTIATQTTPYVMLTPSGTAGSQILTPYYTNTTPVWVNSKSGWYASAASSSRVIACVYKYSATQQCSKFILGKQNGTMGKVRMLDTASLVNDPNIFNGTVPSTFGWVTVSAFSGISTANSALPSIAKGVRVKYGLISLSNSAVDCGISINFVDNNLLTATTLGVLGNYNTIWNGYLPAASTVYSTFSGVMDIPLDVNGKFYFSRSTSFTGPTSVTLTLSVIGFFIGD